MDKLGCVADMWLLENGNYLFSYVSGVKEITKDKKIVWEYKAPNVENYTVQPIENNRV